MLRTSFGQLFLNILIYFLHPQGISTLSAKEQKRISDVMTHWIKTTDSYVCFYIDREHWRTENAMFFFRPVRRIFSVSQSEETRAANKIWSLHHVASRGVRYWKKIISRYFWGFFSITIIRRYFAECVNVLPWTDAVFDILIFCVVSSHQW